MKIRNAFVCFVWVLASSFVCQFASPVEAQVFEWTGMGVTYPNSFRFPSRNLNIPNWEDPSNWISPSAPSFSGNEDLVASYLDSAYSDGRHVSNPIGSIGLLGLTVNSFVFELDASPSSRPRGRWGNDWTITGSSLFFPLGPRVTNSIDISGNTTEPNNSRVDFEVDVYCDQYNIDYGSANFVETGFQSPFPNDIFELSAAGNPLPLTDGPVRFSTTTPGFARVYFDGIGKSAGFLTIPLGETDPNGGGGNVVEYIFDSGVLLVLRDTIGAAPGTIFTVNGSTRIQGFIRGLDRFDNTDSPAELDGGAYQFNDEVDVVGFNSRLSVESIELNATMTIDDGTYFAVINNDPDLMTTPGELTIVNVGNGAPITGTGKIIVSTGGFLRNLSNSEVQVPIEVEAGGTFEGFGTYTQDIEIRDGFLAPGQSVGTQILLGDVDLTTTSTTCIEIDGPPTSMPANNGFDRLGGGGTNNLNLGGTLVVSVIDDYVPNPADEYDIFQNFNVNGTFDNVVFENYIGEVEYGPTFVRIKNLRTLLRGDVNRDGAINFLDISAFISFLQSTGFSEEADLNEDSAVNFLDIAPFIFALTSQ